MGSLDIGEDALLELPRDVVVELGVDGGLRPAAAACSGSGLLSARGDAGDAPRALAVCMVSSAAVSGGMYAEIVGLAARTSSCAPLAR